MNKCKMCKVNGLRSHFYWIPLAIMLPPFKAHKCFTKLSLKLKWLFEISISFIPFAYCSNFNPYFMQMICQSKQGTKSKTCSSLIIILCKIIENVFNILFARLVLFCKMAPLFSLKFINGRHKDVPPKINAIH